MKLTLIDKTEILPGVVTFKFKPEDKFTWRAGQFLRYHFDEAHTDDRGNSRFFTIASAPQEGFVQLTTRLDLEHGSTFKRILNRLKIGESVEAEGPLGSFTVDDISKEYVFIAGGIGITAFRSILLDLSLKKIPFKITLLYANRDQHIIFKETLDEIALKNSQFKTYYLVDPERIDEGLIKNKVADFKKKIYFLSGPTLMTRKIEEMLLELGVLEENIEHDFFPGYSEV